ncbi:MAG: hypothetical protein ACLVEX_00220 [Ruthenibacterium lactatiformans]
MKKKQSSLADRIQPKAWLAISLIAALIVWTILSVLPNTSRSFPNAIVTIQQIKVMLDRGVLLTDIASSLISVSLGYILGFALALPIAILMAWYKPVRYIIEPWIPVHPQYPALAYVPLIVIDGGRGPQAAGGGHHHRHASSPCA